MQGTFKWAPSFIPWSAGDCYRILPNVRRSIPKGPIAAPVVSLLACSAFSCGGSSNNDQSEQPTRTEQGSEEHCSVPQTVPDTEGAAEHAIDMRIARRADRVRSA